MSRNRSIPWHPFRTFRLTGPQVGWFRPAAAVVIASLAPAALAFLFISLGAPVIDGPFKDGSTYTLADHVAIVLGAIALSFLVTWIAAPFAVFALRAAAMLGVAGWGTAMISAWIIGLPIAHVALNGDLTSDDYAILPQLMVAIAILGLSVWVTFWGLMAATNRRQQD